MHCLSKIPSKSSTSGGIQQPSSVKTDDSAAEDAVIAKGEANKANAESSSGESTEETKRYNPIDDAVAEAGHAVSQITTKISNLTKVWKIMNALMKKGD